MKNFIKKIIAFTLVLALIGGIGVYISPQKAYAYEDNSLVTNVTNPTYGTIIFKVTIAPLTTVGYSVCKYSPYSGTYGAVTSGSITNSYTTSSITKFVTVSVNYGGTYLIKSSNTRMQVSDEDFVMNKFSGTLTSSKFIWNTQNVNEFVNGQRISTVIMFGTGILADFAFSKGVATATNIGFLLRDVYDMSAVDIKDIQTTPIVGYSYVIKRIADTRGFETYLYVYNNSNVLQGTFDLGHTNWDIG